MRRRVLLKTAGIGSATLAISGLGLKGTALASDERGFTFNCGAREGSDVVLMRGSGEFEGSAGGDADGGGEFIHFTPSTKTIVAEGKWQARRVLAFTQGPIFSPFVMAGVLDLAIRLKPKGSPRVDATLRIVCELKFLTGGDVAGEEGIVLTVGSRVFSPFAGITQLTPRGAPDD